VRQLRTKDRRCQDVNFPVFSLCILPLFFVFSTDFNRILCIVSSLSSLSLSLYILLRIQERRRGQDERRRGQEHGNITERTRVLRGNQARNTERILRGHSSEEETRPWRGDGVRNQKGKKERTWREYEEKTMQGRNTERTRRSRMRGDEAKNREARNTERIRRENGEKTRPRIRKEYGDNDTRNERNGYFSQNDDRKVPSRTSSDNLNR